MQQPDIQDLLLSCFSKCSANHLTALFVIAGILFEEMSRKKDDIVPDGGIFSSFYEACLCAKNLLKVAVRIEVTKQKLSRTGKLHEDTWNAYQRHADIFIQCGDGDMNSEDRDPYGYRFIRADFPSNITKDLLLASTNEQLLRFFFDNYMVRHC